MDIRRKNNLITLSWVLAAALGVISLGACSGGGSDLSANSLGTGDAEARALLKVSYLQLDAVGSLAPITPGGYAAPDMIYFGFADLRPDAADFNPAYLAAMQTAISNEKTGAVNILSIGGQYATAATINAATAQAVIDKVDAQIVVYNSKLTGGTISGIDLDLENEIDAATITALAQGFKAKGYLVSTAPQVINVDPADNHVDPAHPANLGLTSGGNHNQYGPAIAAGYVDYIMAQAYNSGGWTVGAFDESQVGFFSAISEALNNAVQSDCSAATSLCIPERVKIAVGEPVNAGASGTPNNLFGSAGDVEYDQAEILSQLSDQLAPVLQNYPHIDGIMAWSLNNDYMPQGWPDAYGVAGAFGSEIFGAAPPPALPYFILQVTNSGVNNPGPNAYGSATLVVNGQYWIFGSAVGAGMIPIPPQQYQLWGTLTSSNNPATPGVADSGNLDTIFGNSATSFSTSQIIINGYSDFDSNINLPASQSNCPAGAGYVFEAGHSYNLLVNATLQTCEVNRIN